MKNKGIGNKSQSRDKILYILLAFVFYSVMMVASLPLDRLGNAGKCIISTLLPYFLWQWSISTYTPLLNS